MKVIKGDTLSIIRWRLKNKETPIDLTGTTVEVNFKIGDGPLKTIPNANLTIMAPGTLGKIEYRWRTGDLDAAGLMVGDVRVVSGSFAGKSWKFYLDVEDPVS